MSNKRILKTKYTNKKNKRKYIKKNKKGSLISKILFYTIGFFIIFSALLGFILYQKYIVDLPSINSLQNLEIAESSIIYDREGNELYKIFKEKRTYVPFEDINKNMINAIIATEDKRYWENPGVDLQGLIRAGIYYIIGKNTKVEGTSTITQQLIRNTIIKNEKSIERKVKEIYLAYKLTAGVSKQKILELYLNKISFGHNAFGIEEAAKTFFGKQAKDIGVLEASILAGLPKGPTYYSPYNHQDRIVGYPYVYYKDNTTDITKIITTKDKILHQKLLNKFTNFINSLKSSGFKNSNKTLVCNIKKEYLKKPIRIDNDGCSIIEYSNLLSFLNSIKIEGDNGMYIEYETGRKDIILGRMLEDGYINFDQYKKTIIDSIAFNFTKSKEKIKSPHFIFYVKEYLEEKYGKEIVSMGGLKIYTTLDPKLQKKAEELIEKYSKINSSKFDANNAALISIDNEKGEILSMVGSKDYFDKENGGNVNIITSKLQPGSTFKPFVYSIGMYENEIGTKTPIYDVKTKFPNGYTPSNFDGKFMGKMNLSTALNHSRNIPAIKMFFMAGGEKNIIKFMKKLGVTSLNNYGMYGAPLALGTGEMTPLELAGAYSTFANMGIKKEITPFLRIEDSKGNIIEQKEENNGEQVISKAQAYILNTILSDTSSRPSFWNNYLSIKGRTIAAKTGTSTKQKIVHGRKDISPANLWTIGYTPQITTVVWAGNTNGEKLNHRGNGLEGAGPIWRDFMDFAHKGKKIKKWEKPSGVKQVKISEISGLLPNLESTNKNFIINSLFLNKPSKYDNSFKEIEIDAYCNGLVSKDTPKAAIKKVTLLEFHSLHPELANWENPVQIWANDKRPITKTKGNEYFISREKYGKNQNILTSFNNQVCIRDTNPSNIIIKSNIKNGDNFIVGQNYIELAYRSSKPIIKINVLLGNELIDTINIDNKYEGSYAGNIFIKASSINKNTKLTLRAIDKEYYSFDDINNINIIKNDPNPPKIIIHNPIDKSIKLYQNDFFNLKATIIDRTNLKDISILIDGEIFKNGLKNRHINLAINKNKNLKIGKHLISIEAIDKDNNKTIENIDLEIIEK